MQGLGVDMLAGSLEGTHCMAVGRLAVWFVHASCAGWGHWVVGGRNDPRMGLLD